MPGGRAAKVAAERSRAAESSRRFDADVARFFLALGITGEPARAAELAEVDGACADAWLDQFERPAWMTPRAETARRLYETGTVALDQLRERLDVDESLSGDQRLPTRELLSLIERCFAAAFRLDESVGGRG